MILRRADCSGLLERTARQKWGKELRFDTAVLQQDHLIWPENFTKFVGKIDFEHIYFKCYYLTNYLKI